MKSLRTGSFFLGKRVLEVVQAIEVSEAAEVNEAVKVSEAMKITTEFFRFNQVFGFNNSMKNITLSRCFKKKMLVES